MRSLWWLWTVMSVWWQCLCNCAPTWPVMLSCCHTTGLYRRSRRLPCPHLGLLSLSLSLCLPNPELSQLTSPRLRWDDFHQKDKQRQTGSISVWLAGPAIITVIYSPFSLPCCLAWLLSHFISPSSRLPSTTRHGQIFVANEWWIRD